jgi:spermidine dehydrogenase
MSITRRDFLEGAALALGAPPAAQAALAGQTDEVLGTAHAWRDGRAFDGAAERDADVEDLVVVGAGISGLAGAWLFRRHAGRPVRMLVLDALAEPGGHAQRNEFSARSGRRMVGYGGSQSLDTPSLFSPAAKGLLADIGIDLKRFETEFFDAGWAQRHGLVNQADFFDRSAWGTDRLVLRQPGERATDWLPRTPLPPSAQADWLRLAQASPWARLARPALVARLAAITYAAYLRQVWQVHPALLAFHGHRTAGYFGVGIDATSALDAWSLGLPGFTGLDLGDAPHRPMSPSGRQLKAGGDDYVYHFPDGNHGVVRALLRALRPELVPGEGMQTLSSAVLDAAALDDPRAALRLRQRSTVVGLRHLGPPASAAQVELRYVDGEGRLRAVRARQVLLACWHRVIARLTDEIPPAQRRALQDQVKVPLLYATVLLSNWRAWQRAGVAAIGTPGGFWHEVALDFPVSIGDIRFPSSPDAPMLVHLGKVVVPADGRDPRTQSAAGRQQLLGWSFDFLEDQIRRVLQGALGSFGFDAAHDSEAVTINRWAHGYSYEYMRPWDRWWPAGPLPVTTARRGWGRVAIAGAESGAFAYAHSAIDQATRAVADLLPDARLPAWARFPGPDPQAPGLS